jgi:hypothetical protein
MSTHRSFPHVSPLPNCFASPSTIIPCIPFHSFLIARRDAGSGNRMIKCTRVKCVGLVDIARRYNGMQKLHSPKRFNCPCPWNLFPWLQFSNLWWKRLCAGGGSRRFSLWHTEVEIRGYKYTCVLIEHGQHHSVYGGARDLCHFSIRVSFFFETG